jgi:hypothetical protein
LSAPRLALKANRPILHQDVVDFFADPPAAMSQPVHTTTDGDHGRIEERRHVVCHQVDWLFSDHHFALSSGSAGTAFHSNEAAIHRIFPSGHVWLVVGQVLQG